jgi:hypothetical protein
MGMAEATGKLAARTKVRAAVPTVAFRSAAELQEVLDAALSAVDADPRIGPLVRAAALRVRMEFPDINAVLNVATSEGSDRHLAWAFTDDVPWTPKLRIRMDSDVANRYLQGRESLPLAIARGRCRFEGDARTALLYVPAARLMVEPYRRAVGEHHPDLLVD